jgi:hypothetical protein
MLISQRRAVEGVRREHAHSHCGRSGADAQLRRQRLSRIGGTRILLA